jgi:hypothetical protein
MRSSLVFFAMTRVPNRYLLAKVAAQATRKLHRPHSRIEETLNDALSHLGQSAPLTDTP